MTIEEAIRWKVFTLRFLLPKKKKRKVNNKVKEKENNRNDPQTV